MSLYYPVHGAESAHNVVSFTFPDGQGSLSLGVLNEPVKFCKRTTKYGFIKSNELYRRSEHSGKHWRAAYNQILKSDSHMLH